MPRLRFYLYGERVSFNLTGENNIPGALFLEGLVAHLNEICAGTINEIFDGDPPYRPRGCISQAWSVVEMLRALIRTASRE